MRDIRFTLIRNNGQPMDLLVMDGEHENEAKKKATKNINNIISLDAKLPLELNRRSFEELNK